VSVDELGAAGNRGDVTPRALVSPAPGVRLWWCPLAWDPAALVVGETLLAAAERSRADRFGRPELRARYVAGSATLRRLLGAQLGCAAASVPLVRGPRGRPRIDFENAPDFNVSHTRDRALIAIGNGSGDRVGVDVEHRDRVTAADKLARKFLGAGEQAHLADYPADLQRERFLRWWTCKEAMSKATGDGLSAPFARIAVDIEPRPSVLGGPAPYTPTHWKLWALDVPDGFLATLALWTPPTAPA
jgi:4'-phosphopantetheinyl transferase